MREIYSKLTIKTPEQVHWRRSGVFIVNFEQISHIVLVSRLLTLNNLTPVGFILRTLYLNHPHQTTSDNFLACIDMFN